jgi:hypothetical protein
VLPNEFKPMPTQPKLVLPTVQTCRWRDVSGESAECGLVASFIGPASGELATVSEEACIACCQSFPPSRRKLNPVVAGLLFKAASRVLDAGGSYACGAEQAAALKNLAESSLNLTHPAKYTVTPARAVAPCCWLGDRLSSQTSATCPGDREQPPHEEPIHVCQHPEHEQTAASQCRMCRDWTRQPQVSRFLSLEELLPLPKRRSGPPVKRWAVGVTTSPRRRSTLELCLDSIVRAGWDTPLLFLDGTVRLPDRYCHLPVTWREASIGAWPSWYMALAELLLQQPEADAYVLLQDDVVLYDRESLRVYLERVLWPGDRPGLVSLFYTGVDSTPGWFQADDAWHWGAQGFVLPSGTARSLLTDAELSHSWLAASSHAHTPIPEVLCGWVNRAGIDVSYANPSLSQHIGNTSTIWMDAGLAAGRRAPWFSGSVETAFAAEESLADFPEQAFSCPEKNRIDYQRRVERGRRNMCQLSVVLCGLCRDVRHFLPRSAARVERLGEMFRDYRVLMFENDSTDATREFLSDWQAINSRVDVLSESLGAVDFPQVRSLDRAAWMAQCRNRCRERIVAEYADSDYVIVLDTDLPGGWSYDGVAHTFGDLDWDFVGSYGLVQRLDRSSDQPFSHYDVWAFRPARGTEARKLVNHNELRLQRGDPLLPVESCFGGLGAYRLACLRACEYGGTDCEHVVFHNRIRDAGFSRLFLNPSQITMYSPIL